MPTTTQSALALSPAPLLPTLTLLPPSCGLSALCLPSWSIARDWLLVFRGSCGCRRLWCCWMGHTRVRREFSSSKITWEGAIKVLVPSFEVGNLPIPHYSKQVVTSVVSCWAVRCEGGPPSVRATHQLCASGFPAAVIRQVQVNPLLLCSHSLSWNAFCPSPVVGPGRRYWHSLPSRLNRLARTSRGIEGKSEIGSRLDCSWTYVLIGFLFSKT